MRDILLPYSVEKQLGIDEKKQYYNNLRKYCKQLSLSKSKEMSLGQNYIHKLYMKNFYHHMLQMDGIQNISKNIPAIIVCNHSTAHDIFSMYIAMAELGLSASVMVATDCLNKFSKTIFSLADSVPLDRNHKLSSSNSVLHASANLFAGKNIIIFGESTWNLHPIKAMQDIKKGGSMISAITEFPVIPTILEYIEIPDIAHKECDIYRKIVLRFGEPYYIKDTDDMSQKTMQIQNQMEQMRKSIWSENGIQRDSICSLDSKVYINHTYLKKFGVFGFTYDSEYESQFLRSNEGNLVIENEYFLNKNNQLVPGVTYKKSQR